MSTRVVKRGNLRERTSGVGCHFAGDLVPRNPFAPSVLARGAGVDASPDRAARRGGAGQDSSRALLDEAERDGGGDAGEGGGA